MTTNNEVLSILKDIIETRMKLNNDDAVLRDIVADNRKSNPAIGAPPPPLSALSDEEWQLVLAEEERREAARREHEDREWEAQQLGCQYARMSQEAAARKAKS